MESKPSMVFEVEKVIGISAEGTYQVQWAPAWVSKFHLVGCEHLIQEFLQEQAAEGTTFEEECETVEPVHENEVVSNETKEGYFVPSLQKHIKTEDVEMCPLQSCDVELPIEDLDGNQNLSLETVCAGESGYPSSLGMIDINSEMEETADSKFDGLLTLPASDPSTPINKTSSNVYQMNYTEMTENLTVSADITEDDIENDNDGNSHDSSIEDINHSNIEAIETSTADNNFDTDTAETDSGYEKRAEEIICKFCSKTFTRRNSLKRHLLTHTGKRDFACTECGKTFVRKDTLYNHLNTHAGERPFSCELCGKTFVQSGHRNFHMRTCAGNSTVKNDFVS